jgi:ABC-type sugar transport system substrate-binding protein
VSERPQIWEFDCRSMRWINEPVSRRKVLAGGASSLLGLTFLGALAGCGSASDDGRASGGGGKLPGAGKTIALSLNGFNTYDQNTAEGCLKALAGTGYKLIGAEAQFNATQEVANIKQLIARQPHGIIVLAASADGAARACAQAKERGIPVVSNLWFPIGEEADSVWFAATEVDNDLSGKLVLDYIAKEKGITSGKILEITGLDAQPLSQGYKRGLRKYLAPYPELEVVASQQGLYTADGALKVLKPMLSAHPDAKVILSYAAEMGVAIAQELKRQGRTDMLHITSDGNDRAIEWLKNEGARICRRSAGPIRWSSAPAAVSRGRRFSRCATYTGARRWTVSPSTSARARCSPSREVSGRVAHSSPARSSASESSSPARSSCPA